MPLLTKARGHHVTRPRLKEPGSPCEALLRPSMPTEGILPLLVRWACALARLAGLSVRGCSVGVVDDLVWAPGISGIPSAEGTSLNPCKAYRCQPV